MLWRCSDFPCDSRYALPSQADLQLCVGSFNGLDQMFSQPVEICKQLVESRTVIADTRRNTVVNSSELGFNMVSYRSNSYASRSNSCELGFNIVSYRSNSYASRSKLCHVAVFGRTSVTRENPRHYYDICTTPYA